MRWGSVLVALTALGCSSQQSSTPRTVPVARPQVASSASASVFAGCRGAQEEQRTTIECRDYVLLAISVPGKLAVETALDQAIMNAGIETGRSELQLLGEVRPVRSYELRNPGAKEASVSAMVVAIPRDDDTVVMHCGSPAATPALDRCQQAYAAFLERGIPAEVIAASKHSQTSVDFAGRELELEAGCQASTETSVECEKGEFRWEVRDNANALQVVASEHVASTKEKVEARGGKVTSEKQFACLLDLSPAECTETNIDLGMKQLGTLRVITAATKLRGKSVFAVCSYFPDDNPDGPPAPCSDIIDL